MAYSVNSETKVATLDGVEYKPSAVHDGKELTYVALTEDECKFFKDLHATIPAQQLEYLRKMRNQKLAETDWTQSRDITLTNDADWQTYRQALRDITDTYTSLDDVTWPEKP
jgi:DNA replication initiation complex subunit (GINS family)